MLEQEIVGKGEIGYSLPPECLLSFLRALGGHCIGFVTVHTLQK